MVDKCQRYAPSISPPVSEMPRGLRKLEHDATVEREAMVIRFVRIGLAIEQLEKENES